MIRVNSISYRYSEEGQYALKDVSFEVKKGGDAGDCRP